MYSNRAREGRSTAFEHVCKFSVIRKLPQDLLCLNTENIKYSWNSSCKALRTSNLSFYFSLPFERCVIENDSKLT